MSFDLDGYVDVAERIREFYEKYPDGRLVAGSAPAVVEIGGKPFIWYHARAYRTPDDPLPGEGWAAEPVPGPTQFTKDSELMNSETAAWGRAIVSLGFATKKIASAEEVRNRQTTAADMRNGDVGEFRFPSGKHQGKTLAEVPREYLTWYGENGPREDVKTAIQVFLGFDQSQIPAGALADDDIPFAPTMDGVL